MREAETPRQPVVDFDHHSAQFGADPPSAWRWLADACPIAWSEHHGGYWIASGYEANHDVLKNHAVFSSARVPSTSGDHGLMIPGPPPSIVAYPEELDPPLHGPVRQLLNTQLSPAACQAMQPRIEHWTTASIDAVIEAGLCDLLYDVAGPVPAHVTLEWMGFPREHVLETAERVHDMLGYPPGSPRRQAAIRDHAVTEAVLRETVTARRAEPRDDAISWFMTQEIDGRPVDDESIVALCLVLVGGGVDTTTSLTSSALLHLNRDRELRTRLLEEPGLLESATEEFLRYYPPLVSIARTAKHDVDLRGCPIREGDRVLVNRYGANYDPTAFDDPDSFVADRFPNRHVSFGLGPHRCSGSHLARLMFQEMVRQILNRMPDYEIDEEQVVPYPDRSIVQGYTALPARFTPGPRSGGAA